MLKFKIQYGNQGRIRLPQAAILNFLSIDFSPVWT